MAKVDVTVSKEMRNLESWRGDYSDRNHAVPGPFRLDPTQFVDSMAMRVTVGSGGAAANATTVPVTITGEKTIPVGTVLRFSATQYARTTAAATSATTSLAVEALPEALAADDEAIYNTRTVVHVPSGTVVGRTLAEANNGDGFGPAAASDDEIYLLLFDVGDALSNPDCEMCRPNSQVRTNFLPNWGDVPSAVQAIVRQRYLCTIGAV